MRALVCFFSVFVFLHNSPSFALPVEKINEEVNAFFKASGATAASIAIMQGGDWKFEKHFGAASDESLYDLASLTKVIATGSAVLRVLDLGWAKAQEPVVKELPEFEKCARADQLMPGFQNPGPFPTTIPCEKKKAITIEQLMRHRSGLRDLVFIQAVKHAKANGFNPVSLFVQVPITIESDTVYKYADMNFIILRAWVERVLAEHDKNFESFLRDEIFKPLTMNSTFLMTPSFQNITRLVPTLKNGRLGAIHDQTAEALGALKAGHAGVFSKLTDLKKFAEFWLGKPKATPTVLSDETRALAIKAPSFKPEEGRGLGWDLTSPTSASARGPMTKGFGHTGYTGTSIWIEPNQKIAVIILTNRTYAKSDAETIGSTNRLRKALAEMAWSGVFR